MAGPVRRTAAPPAAVAEGVNFGDLNFYIAGGGLPEGDYALFFTVQMYQWKKQTGQLVGEPTLSVVVDCYPLSDPTEEAKLVQPYGMGRKAHLSFAPNPDTGKGVVAIPGGPASNCNNMTNWAVFLKSLYDSGLPPGIFTNDLTVLDGIHAHLVHIPEPAERKGFASATAEVTADERNKTIAVVSEIKEDGKPWEGTGGLPAAPAKGKAPAAKAPAKAPARAAAPAPAPVAEAPAENEDVETAAINAVSDVLTTSPNGCPKLVMRTTVFNKLGGTKSDMAQAVIDQYFGTDQALNALLGQVGYVLAAGGKIQPA